LQHRAEAFLVKASFTPVAPDERDALIAFIAADTYPYNGTPQPTPAQVASWLNTGLYTESFWITCEDGARIGAMHYSNASAVHAEVHIRLHRPYRGQGAGTQAVAWLTDYLFRTYPAKHRVEGWTRVDNTAMRRVFRHCGYVKQAHLRDDFVIESDENVENGGRSGFMDKVGYGILRDDWRTKTITPVNWHDEDAIPEAR